MTTPPSASNTIIKIKAIPSGERLKLDAAINGIISKEIYRFDNNGEVIIPFQQYIQFKNGNQVAEIDLRHLLPFPQYEHHIYAQTYNTLQPFKDTKQTQIIITLHQFLANSNKGLIPMDIIFHDAKITHDTQIFGKMAPYIKLFVNGAEIYRSSVVKGGDKTPNFNKESAKVQFKNLKDQMKIQIWDKDMKKDDLIGSKTFLAYQLLNRRQIIVSSIGYMDKTTLKNAGEIRFEAKSDYIN